MVGAGDPSLEPTGDRWAASGSRLGSQRHQRPLRCHPGAGRDKPLRGL